jgi:hypothetical protein
MKSITVLVLFGVSALALVPEVVRADDYYFLSSGSTGDWDDQNNWATACANGQGYGQAPSASDNVAICSGKTADVKITTAVCRTLTVSSGTAVRILPQTGSDATLTVGHTTSDPPLQHFIFGSVTLGPASGSHHATLAFVATSHFIRGGPDNPPTIIGEIKGQDDDAAITIGTNETLTSYLLLIHGNLQIAGAGSFTNEGSVQADANGTLAVEIDGFINDTSGSNRWKATTPPSGNSLLLFIGNLDSIELITFSGEFVVNNANAKIQVDDLPNIDPFSTSGRLNMSAGTFEALDNVSFSGGGGALNMTGGQIIVHAGKTLTHY